MGIVQERALESLRRSWRRFAVACGLFLAGGAALLFNWESPSFAIRWLGLAGLVLAYLLAVLGRNLTANHRPGEDQLLSNLGWGNRVSLLRGVFLAGLLGFAFSPQPDGPLAWAPGILYTLAIVSDFLDGFLARVTNHSTRLGEILDISFDGVGVFGATLLLVGYDKAPAWFILVGLARYLFLGGEWLRRRLGKPIYELPPSASRRLMAGLMMGFLAALLWPAFTPPGTMIAATLFGIPFLYGFGRDWLFASGVMQAKQERNPQEQLSLWLPVFLRAALPALAFGPLLERYRDFGALDGGMMVLTVLESLALILLVLGAAGRSAAILGLVLLGFQQMGQSLTTGQIVQIGLYTALLYMGSGALSLWKPEDYLIHHRAGERRRERPSKTSLGGEGAL